MEENINNNELDPTQVNPETGIPTNEGLEIPSGEGLSEPEMRENIESGFAKLDQKENEVKSKMSSAMDEINQFKIDTLNRMFQMMIAVGVDPSDQASISAFMSKLYAQDPDLVALFESVFKGVAPGENDMGQGQAPMPPTEGMPAPLADEGIPPIIPTDGMPPIPPVESNTPPVPGLDSHSNTFS